MCGITGFWQKQVAREDPEETLSRMSAVLFHRGPDDSGDYFDPSLGIGLAFRRLAILDVSPQGHQPMWSASNRYLIIFNGEVYNFREIRKELPEFSWRGNSDTEVMLAAIEKWGLQSAVQRFVGMFAFALWDRTERKLHLVRDRLGIKPLYWGHVGRDLVFASELKAIRQYPGFQGEVDRDVLALYFRYNYVPSPYCIYRGMHKLQPGCILTLARDEEAPIIESFWSAEDIARLGTESRLALAETEAVDLLEQELLRAVRLRMISDVPLGAFLSGGIDSSTVVALMQAQSSRPVKTFTIGFREDEFNEAVYAKKVAQHLGTDHTELYVTGQNALDVVPLLSTTYDEPFADSSQIPTYLVSKLARSAVTVSLSGDGGDELFGGYPRYLLSASVWNMVNRIPRIARRPITGCLRALPVSTISAFYRLTRPFLPQAWRVAGPAAKVRRLAEYLSVNSRDALYRRIQSLWEEPTSIVEGAQEPDLPQMDLGRSSWLNCFEEALMLTDLVSYLPDDLLVKVDRASMAVSLEARVPLLDHHVVALAWRLPVRLKIRDGLGKWILRQVLKRYVPESLFNRPKAGFGIPISDWLRGPLRPWAEELLSSNCLEQAGLNVGVVRSKWNEHLDRKGSWHYQLWNVLMFQDWLAHSGSRNCAKSPAELVVT